MTDNNANNYAERMHALFTGLPRAYGVYQLEAARKGVTKRAGRAKTVQGEVTLELWMKHLRGEQGLGIVPIRDDGTCVFGAIDIDKYDLDFAAVEESIAKIGLPTVLCKTKSGGLHVYAFTSEPVAASLMKSRLSEWATAIGFGSSEIFPKQDNLLSAADVGNWINMPYFGALADGGSARYAIYKNTPQSLDEFLDRAEAWRVTEAQLEQLTIPEEEDFLNGPPCLQALLRSNGFVQGARNNAMFDIGVYLRKRFPDDWEERITDYNNRLMNPILKAAELANTVKSLKRKNYSYKCGDAPIKSVCNRRLCKQREFGIGKGSGGAEDWPFMVDNDAQCVMTKPPYWIVTFDGKRVRMTREHFASQSAFKHLIIDELHIVPPALKPVIFDEKMNDILRNAQNVEAPEESGVEGELKWFLTEFCTNRPQAQTREEVLVGKPWSEDGKTYFRAADLKKFLLANNFRELVSAKLYAALRDIGVQHCQLAIRRGITIQVWYITTPQNVTMPEEDDDEPLVGAHHVPSENTEM